MTSIKHIPDDLGVRSLRQDNLRPETAHPVNATSSVSPVTASTTNLVNETRPQQDRRRIERRQTSRRQQDEQALLDTRSGEERRKSKRRQAESATEQSDTFRHIDVEV